MNKLPEINDRISIVGPPPYNFRITDWGTEDMFCDYLTEVIGREYSKRVEENERDAYISVIYLTPEMPVADMNTLLANYQKYERDELNKGK